MKCAYTVYERFNEHFNFNQAYPVVYDFKFSEKPLWLRKLYGLSCDKYAYLSMWLPLQIVFITSKCKHIYTLMGESKLHAVLRMKNACLYMITI